MKQMKNYGIQTHILMMDSAQPIQSHLQITNSLVSFSTIFEFFSIQELYKMQLISKKLYYKVIPHVFPGNQVINNQIYKDFYYIGKTQRLYKVNQSLQWTMVSDFLDPDYCSKWQSSIQVNERWVYFIGGADLGKQGYSSKEVLIYDIKSNSLSRKAKFHRARQNFGLAYFKDEIFVICGDCDVQWGINWCERYSITQNEWAEMPDMIVGLVGPAALVLSNRYIYLFGGQQRGLNSVMTQQFYRFDLIENSAWEPIIFASINQIFNGCHFGVIKIHKVSTLESDQVLIIGGRKVTGFTKPTLGDVFKVTLYHNEPEKNNLLSFQDCEHQILIRY
ncbi:hypothetical protein FGO68_gene13318 [Halteria grandinella]|uniref:Kelch motif family protein n=1 Tax=Halteria grandinella TaxID=5974 RepID=A0A8J8NLS9_HALGN|nr:hypothetical protein FGO68_gene13318 [Halteria grandinella]